MIPSDSAKLIKAPHPPKTLGPIGQAHWKQTFSLLVRTGVATEFDKPVIEMACTQYEQFRTAETDTSRQAAIASYLRIMSKYGATPKDRKMMKLSVDYNIKRKADREAIKRIVAEETDDDIESELGL